MILSKGRQNMFWVQRAAAIFFICSLGVFLFALFERNNEQAHAFLPRGEFVQFRPVELQQEALANGLFQHRAFVQFEEKFPPQVKKISFWLATWGQSLAFNQATLSLGSAECELSRVLGSIKDNSYLTFDLPENCNPSAPLTTELTLVTQANSKIALWCQELTSDWLPSSLMKVKILSVEGKHLGYALGNYVKEQVIQETRLRVLLGAWNLKNSTVFIFLMLIVFFGFVLFGALNRFTESNRWLIKMFGTLSVVGMLWCVLVPPFQAPDEPDHIMSFLELTKTQEKLGPALLVLAQRTHFERIKFNEIETVSLGDLNQPTQAPWAGHIQGPDYNDRAPLLAFFAKKLSNLGIEKANVENLVLFLRFVNVGSILLCFLFCMKFLSADLLPMVYLLAPPIFFFGMHVSNYPMSLAVLFPAITATVVALIRADKLSFFRSLVIIPLSALGGFYLNRTTAQLFPYFTVVMTAVLGLLFTSRISLFKKLTAQKTQFIGFGALLILFILALLLGLKFTPLPNVERPPYPLDPIKQAVKASLVFISNTFGLAKDYSVTDTFWNGIGWLDVRTTEFIATITRYSWIVLVGFSFVLLKGQNRITHASKIIISIFALALSVGFLSYSLQNKASVNLSGRYLLPIYITFFTTVICILQVALKNLNEQSEVAVKNTVLLMGVSFNLLYLSSVLVRYYS